MRRMVSLLGSTGSGEPSPRHRLLRKPGGFEGFVVIPEVLEVEDPSSADREDLRELHVRFGAKARAVPDLSHDHSFTGVDEVADRFHGVGVPGRPELLELAHDRVAPYEWPRLGPTFGRPRDDVWVIHLTKGVHVASVPRGECGAHDLHVLLRHRLLPQPGGFESLRFARKPAGANDLAIANGDDLVQGPFKLYAARPRSCANGAEYDDVSIPLDASLDLQV